MDQSSAWRGLLFVARNFAADLRREPQIRKQILFSREWPRKSANNLALATRGNSGKPAVKFVVMRLIFHRAPPELFTSKVFGKNVR